MTNDRPMTFRRQVREAAVQALQIALPDVYVYTPGDWNTPAPKLPAIKLRTPRDAKQAMIRGMPQFTTTVTLELEAAAAPATKGDDAQDAIEALSFSIEQALMLYGPLVAISQKFPSVTTEIEVSADGQQHFGALKMMLEVEGFEVFDPTAAPVPAAPWPPAVEPIVPLESLGVHADLQNIYSTAGTFTPSPDAPPYTPTPAPRTSGPDGRDEGAIDITLPQT